MANIDLQNLYKQGKPVQLGAAAGVAALVMLVAYLVVFSGQIDDIKALRDTEENTLKPEFADKARQAANLPVLKKELEDIRQTFEVLLKQLPTDAEIPNLIQELHKAGADNSMRMNSVKPLSPIDHENIQQLPYQISLSGNYEQISKFVRDVGRLSRIVTVDTVNLEPADSKENTGVLTLTAHANTYKALETTASEPAAAQQ